MSGTWKRRDILVALAALPLGPLSALAKDKLGLCQACNGNGQCASGYCGSGGRCLPTSNVCAAHAHKKNFRCKGARAKCCGSGGCVTIRG